MQTEDNAVIRYLMKEMDPSEEVLMERAMMKDDDLLIEVESMRQTMGRLEELPEKEPPAHLSESIIQQATEQSSHVFALPSIPSEVFKYAAVLLIGVGIGGGIWMVSAPSSSSSTSAVQTAPQTATPTSFGIFSTSNASEQNAAVEPWVDHGNMIYFQDMVFEGEASQYKAILKTSMQKLQPVDEQALPIMTNNRDVQLTSTAVNN